MEKYIIVVFISYLMGSIHFSFLLGRYKRHVDIREHGSKNSGAANALIVFGPKIGVMTATVDVLKGTFAVMIIRHLYPDDSFIATLSALVVVLGHMYPFYMKFRGGKGLATSIGVTLGISFYWALAMFITLIVFTLLTDYIAVGTGMTEVCGFTLIAINYGISAESLCYLILASLIIAKHIPNYVKIYRKEEFHFLDTVRPKKGKDTE